MEVGIVGAGIVGLTLARELLHRDPSCSVTVLEKESSAGRHQTSHNSGVVHAGLYYAPGSLKATLCGRGRVAMRDYCIEKALPYNESGKLVVALDESELPGLRAIYERATANGVPDLRMLDRDQIREIEPHVHGLAAVHSPRTAVVDFAGVARAVAEDVTSMGGAVHLNSAVTSIRRGGRIDVVAGGEGFTFDRLVVCAGAQSDRVARLAGAPQDPRIVPFLGMYYQLRPERRDLVRSLIYPVPDPRYPFLGVHLTRTIDDEVLIGPNAVLGLAREIYRAGGTCARDIRDIVGWPGFYRMAGRNWRAGLKELRSTLSRRVFVAAARRYVPELREDDVEPARAGVRAQAVSSTGALVDDFTLQDAGGVLSVRNAPSPAATSSFAIAAHLAPQVLGHR